MTTNVARLIHLATLHSRGVDLGRAHRAYEYMRRRQYAGVTAYDAWVCARLYAQRLEAIEADRQAAVDRDMGRV